MASLSLQTLAQVSQGSEPIEPEDVRKYLYDLLDVIDLSGATMHQAHSHQAVSQQRPIEQIPLFQPAGPHHSTDDASHGPCQADGSVHQRIAPPTQPRKVQRSLRSAFDSAAEQPSTSTSSHFVPPIQSIPNREGCGTQKYTVNSLLQQRPQPLRYGDIQAILQNVTMQLWCLHDNDTVHRALTLDAIEVVSFSDLSYCRLSAFGNITSVDAFGQCHMQGTLPHRPYLAPEVLFARPGAKVYTTAADMWSLGVMMFAILSGGTTPFQHCHTFGPAPKPPAVAPTVDELQRWIDQQLTTAFEQLSSNQSAAHQAIPLIQELLKADPAQRLTARQLLRHPWLSPHDQPLSPVTPFEAATAFHDDSSMCSDSDTSVVCLDDEQCGTSRQQVDDHTMGDAGPSGSMERSFVHSTQPVYPDPRHLLHPAATSACHPHLPATSEGGTMEPHHTARPLPQTNLQSQSASHTNLTHINFGVRNPVLPHPVGLQLPFPPGHMFHVGQLLHRQTSEAHSLASCASDQSLISLARTNSAASIVQAHGMPYNLSIGCDFAAASQVHFASGGPWCSL